jgi:hypothetical protein
MIKIFKKIIYSSTIKTIFLFDILYLELRILSLFIFIPLEVNFKM